MLEKATLRLCDRTLWRPWFESPQATGRSRDRRSVTASSTVMRSALGKPLTLSWLAPGPRLAICRAYESLRAGASMGSPLANLALLRKVNSIGLAILRDLVGN